MADLPIKVYKSRESTDKASSKLWKMGGKAMSKSTAVSAVTNQSRLRANGGDWAARTHEIV